MSDIHTFTEVENKWTITVKADFLKRCPDPHTKNKRELFVEFHMGESLHNPGGPAVIRLKDKKLSFWIDGKCIQGEEEQKMAHAYQFGEKLVETINND